MILFRRLSAGSNVDQESSALCWLWLLVMLGPLRFTDKGSIPQETSKDDAKRTTQGTVGHGTILGENVIAHVNPWLSDHGYAHTSLGLSPSEYDHYHHK